MGGSGAAGGVSRQITGAGSADLDDSGQYRGLCQQRLGIGQSKRRGWTACSKRSHDHPADAELWRHLLHGGWATTSLATLATSTSTYVTPLGNAVANNIQFMLFGVDTNRTLYSYDLLQNLNWCGGVGADSAQAIADGVVQMNALYGVDTNGDWLFRMPGPDRATPAGTSTPS